MRKERVLLSTVPVMVIVGLLLGTPVILYGTGIKNKVNDSEEQINIIKEYLEKKIVEMREMLKCDKIPNSEIDHAKQCLSIAETCLEDLENGNIEITSNHVEDGLYIISIKFLSIGKEYVFEIESKSKEVLRCYQTVKARIKSTDNTSTIPIQAREIPTAIEGIGKVKIKVITQPD